MLTLLKKRKRKKIALWEKINRLPFSIATTVIQERLFFVSQFKVRNYMH
jgi:hypothetical protein